MIQPRQNESEASRDARELQFNSAVGIEIFTRTAVSFPTGMQTPRRHYTTTSVGKPISRGALSRFVATEVIQFVLYFLFLFEQFRHHPELPIGMRSVHTLCILLARISTGIFRMKRSALRGTSSPLLHRVPIVCVLYRRLRVRDVTWGQSRSHCHRTLDQG